MTASLRGEYSEQTFSGSSLRDFSVFPSGSGFYVENAELNPNDIVSDAFPPLVDNPPDLAGGDAINIGLDFGEAVEVDMLQLSLSGELDTNSHIDDLANWTVYVSDDRVSWVSRPVDRVEYFAEEDRLDIRFSPAAFSTITSCSCITRRWPWIRASRSRCRRSGPMSAAFSKTVRSCRPMP
jgi:hypothetical protein